jgi:hypothetical protein
MMEDLHHIGTIEHIGSHRSLMCYQYALCFEEKARPESYSFRKIVLIRIKKMSPAVSGRAR